jgi:hypothetical protein
MPIHSTFTPKHNLVISVLQAAIQPDELQYYSQRFIRTKEYQQASAFLLDTQPARIKSLPEIEPLIRCYASVPQPARIVVVANQPPEQVTRFEQDCREASLNVIVFNALHPACTWLGLDLIETNQAIRRLLKKA